MYDEKKWWDFNEMIKDAKREGIQFVVISRPEILGECYEDINENLKRLGEGGIFILVRGVNETNIIPNNRIKRFL